MSDQQETGQWILRNTAKDNEDRILDSEDEAEETKNDIIALGAKPENLEIIPPDDHDKDHDSNEKSHDSAENTETNETQAVERADQESQQRPAQSDTANPVKQELHHNPIDFLRGINDEFVNTIKGKPAISKAGFRFIQREFEISTESEVVEVVDDPLGCIVWAKAEHPSGYSAEAHGEGWRFESDVDDNEFVRYADTRAKSRALSDLTSAGALAVSELTGGENDT